MLPFPPQPRAADERATLQAMLDANRALILWKLEGLDEEQARRRIVASETSLLGIAKHLAWVERWWFCDFIGGQEIQYPWTDEDPDADWAIEPDDTVASISELYATAVAEANAAIADVDSLDETRDDEGEAWSLRWVMAHMIEETARHAGHADIIRELVDGSTGYVPWR